MRKRIAGLQVMAKRRSSKSAPGHTCVGSEKKKRLYVWPSQPATGNPPSLIRSQHNRERKKTIYFTKETQHMEGGMGNRPLPSFVQPVRPSLVPIVPPYNAGKWSGNQLPLFSPSPLTHTHLSHTHSLSHAFLNHHRLFPSTALSFNSSSAPILSTARNS